ncbi:hypothetical protein AA313_de0203471 [Arthrobotrys entomopaga]|nr:hypothetical protein AA313_de0203471 [Arthrobotrys entomopaga]
MLPLPNFLAHLGSSVSCRVETAMLPSKQSVSNCLSNSLDFDISPPQFNLLFVLFPLPKGLQGLFKHHLPPQLWSHSLNHKSRPFFDLHNLFLLFLLFFLFLYYFTPNLPNLLAHIFRLNIKP